MKTITIAVIAVLALSSCSEPLAEYGCGFESPKHERMLRTDIAYLADDALEGREAGTPGAKKAADYIARRFTKLKLTPLGKNRDYFQEFTFKNPIKVEDSSFFEVKGTTFTVGPNFYPVKWSAKSGNLRNHQLVNVGYGIEAPRLGQRDYSRIVDEPEGKLFIMDIGSPDGVHPHSKFIDYHDIQGRIDLAIEKGAAGILLVDRKNQGQDLQRSFRTLNEKPIPIAFIQGPADSLIQYAAKASLVFSMEEQVETGRNVVGLLDNGQEHTVVIGAHYDHLGYGGDGSLHRGEPQIHNGADDNASGTAALIELARYYSQSKNHPFNYLFIAFSAEEKGLLGSNHFVKNPVHPLSKMAYMINMDMIGRLDSNVLIINGAGTSPLFSVLDSVNCGNLTLKINESGVGPSDHTSFYLNDIPVLSFFTGAHDDYHKPTDDLEKVNVEGMISILSYIVQVNEAMAGKGKPEFTPTKDKEQKATPRFKVTMGIVPDYGYSGKGMRIDGVTDGRPGAKAGVKAGDLVVKLGPYNVGDIYGYMEALSQYNLGDTTSVVVKRNGKKEKLKLKFNE